MESINIVKGDKEKVYESLIPQILALTEGERDSIANMANISAALKEAFGFWWVGFYIVRADASQHGSSLVLGPFQGPVACTRITFGRGVCGTAWKLAESVIVPDVEQFPGHIACSSLSKSEIVVPVFRNGEVVAVLDIDSDKLEDFDERDKMWLERLLSSNIVL
ncbi:MAG: GAF domain-containing protein [Bacteroidales bacterium]|jgi:GAF domain-containing protein|nr:GAF domain-containing protein [Bacteroidales bacterium]MDD4057434.1 GAF domain-containing protein [Bacteroidales bacterium]